MPTELKLIVHGVHHVECSEAVFRATVEEQWGSNLNGSQLRQAEERVRAHFAGLYLIEVEVCGGTLDFGKVTQEMLGQPRDNWQVPYNEQPTMGGRRWAFFFHFLDLKRPLQTPGGLVHLPKPTPIPEHLRTIQYALP